MKLQSCKILKLSQLCLLMGSSLLVSMNAYAGRPMVTDDAGITEHRHCELESWYQRGRGTDEQWALGACNLTGNLELTLGWTRERQRQGGSTENLAVMQFKTVLRDVEEHDWGVALAIGTEVNRKAQFNNAGYYALLPVTWSVNDGQQLIHFNLGLAHDAESHENDGLWGLGLEHALTSRSSLFVESFGQFDEDPLYQLGAAYWLVPDRLQLDVSYGDRWVNRDRDRFFSVGFVWHSSRF